MNRTKKIIGLGLGLAVMVTTMSLAFATEGQSQASADTGKPKYHRMEQFKERGGMPRIDILSDLVKAGTITADQQKAILEAIKPTKDITKDATKKDSTTMEAQQKEKLDALVKAGTITQAQEDAVVKAFSDDKAKREAEMQKKLEALAAQKGITVDELKAQMENNKKAGVVGDFKGGIKGRFHGQNPEVLSDLVTAGTITADQQKAIQEAMRPDKEVIKDSAKKGLTKIDPSARESEMKAKLDALVKAGTITQTQEDVVLKAFSDDKAKLEAEQQKKLEDLAAKKGITVDELKAQMKEGMKSRFNSQKAE